MESRELLELAQSIRSGDNTLLKDIFEKHAGFCIGVLVSKHGCQPEDAEDIYIDAILNFRERIVAGKLDSVKNTRAYIYATCKNMWVSKMKRDQKVNQAATEFYSLKDPEEILLYLETDISYKEEILSITREALTVMPENCRNLLEGYYFNKLNLEELAENFGFANGNVAKVSKSRCFQRLVKQIKIIQKRKEKLNAIR